MEWYLLDNENMIKNKWAFTFVELIVVIAILAILSTVWFTTYQQYLAGSRDTNRMVQLNEIRDWLKILSSQTKLPFPEDAVEISANGSLFAYQGLAGSNVMKAIWYDGGGLDPEYDVPYTYMLTHTGRDFQLMWYIWDSKLLTFLPSTHADTIDYINMFPKVVWSPLGIMLEKNTQIPLNKLTNIVWNSYDIVTWTETTLSYFSDTQFLDSTFDDLTEMIPNQSCKRIKDLGKAWESWKYLISPNGSSTLQVYCDMDIEWGGWTFAGHVDGGSAISEISFASAVWTYNVERKDTWTEYFLDMSQFEHTEMMALINTKSPQEANNTNSFLMLRYGLDAPMFHTATLSSCPNPLWSSDILFHKTKIWWEYMSSKVWWCWTAWYVRPQDYNPTWGPLGLYLLYFRESTTAGTRWSSDAWRWLNGEWDGISTTNSFWNDVWIYIR